MVFGVYFVVSR